MWVLDSEIEGAASRGLGWIPHVRLRETLPVCMQVCGGVWRGGGSAALGSLLQRLPDLPYRCKGEAGG